MNEDVLMREALKKLATALITRETLIRIEHDPEIKLPIGYYKRKRKFKRTGILDDEW